MEFTYGSVETNYTNSCSSLLQKDSYVLKRSIEILPYMSKPILSTEIVIIPLLILYLIRFVVMMVGLKNHIKGILRKNYFSNKGYILYEFEANELYANKSSLNYTGYNYIADPAVQYYGE
jgi:hypothetical protein